MTIRSAVFNDATPLDEIAMLHIAAKRYPDMTMEDFKVKLLRDELSIVLRGGRYYDNDELLYLEKRASLVGRSIN